MPLRPWSKWTANSDKELNVNKLCMTSQKTAFRLQKRHLAGTFTVHILPFVMGSIDENWYRYSIDTSIDTQISF